MPAVAVVGIHQLRDWVRATALAASALPHAALHLRSQLLWSCTPARTSRGLQGRRGRVQAVCSRACQCMCARVCVVCAFVRLRPPVCAFVRVRFHPFPFVRIHAQICLCACASSCVRFVSFESASPRVCEIFASVALGGLPCDRRRHGDATCTAAYARRREPSIEVSISCHHRHGPLAVLLGERGCAATGPDGCLSGSRVSDGGPHARAPCCRLSLSGRSPHPVLRLAVFCVC
mmetsp:Transcript_6267/g.13665  ORF Transcript_6267/g.13665 Transcript_6267/m.13665 type:complete len:233 (+) Transcript_6267:917-1615(+)